MSKREITYEEVQALYELCTNGKDLKEFCQDSGVNYSKFVTWQRKQLWNIKLGRTEEKSSPRMAAINITDMPPQIPEQVSVKDISKKNQNPIRFIMVKLTDGVTVKRYDITTEDVVSLLTKLTEALC